MRRRLGSIDWIVPGVKARIRVSGGFNPSTGERRKLDRTVMCNEREAEKVLARMLLEVGVVANAREITVKAYLEDMWYPHLERRRAQGKLRRETIKGYRSKCDCHVIPRLGSVRLAKLDTFTLDRWMGDLAVAGMSDANANAVYRVMHGALAQAVAWDLIPVNPLARVDAPRVPKRKRETYAKDELGRLLAAFDGSPIRPLVVIALATGLRVSEVAALDHADVDHKAGTVTVRRGFHAGKKSEEPWFEPTKTELSARTIALGKWAKAELRDVRGIGPLVCEDGERMRPARIAKLYRAALKAAGMRYVPLQNLRHTHATIALKNGARIEVVSRRLGHSTIRTTVDNYVEVDAADDAEAADLFGQALSAQRGTSRRSAQRGTRK